MTQDWTRDVAHVVRCGELAATQCRKRFGAEQECDGSARACAVEDRRMRARASDYLNNIALHSRLDARVAHFKTAARDGIGVLRRQRDDTAAASGIAQTERIPAEDGVVRIAPCDIGAGSRQPVGTCSSPRARAILSAGWSIGYSVASTVKSGESM